MDGRLKQVYFRMNTLFELYCYYNNALGLQLLYMLPYLLYLVHSGLNFFKVALEMLGKTTSQSAPSENDSCLIRIAVMAVFTF